jgi:triacylglycerol lipase
MSFLTTLPRDRYKSDAFAAFDPTGGDFVPGTAQAMAWVSQLAYETADPAKIASIARDWAMTIPAGGIISEEVATVLPKSSTQLLVTTRDSVVIVSFAGTDPLVLADWITDFDFGVTSVGSANGYTAAAQAVWPRIQSVLQGAIAEMPIFVTGHSLGGALAVLTAQRLHAARPGRVRAVYTFGMPRTGNPSFASGYDQALGSRTYRFVHGEDVVPTVAPSFFGFRHVGRLLHCARLGKFDVNALALLGSDEPQFVKGISNQLKGFLHGPLSKVTSLVTRYKLAAALTVGMGPAGMRTDPGGIAIELLPPPLRDHMPDRYIGATSVAVH